MKVRMTLEVPDELRRFIAEMERNCPTTKDGLASRFAVAKYVQNLVAKLNATQEALELDRNRIRQEILMAPLTAAEIEDNKQAVSWLRAQGKSDPAIREWLLHQKARLAINNERERAA